MRFVRTYYAKPIEIPGPVDTAARNDLADRIEAAIAQVRMSRERPFLEGDENA